MLWLFAFAVSIPVRLMVPMVAGAMVIELADVL